VVPSECYENAPLAVLESQAAGRPVVGSNLGGIPELIDPGRDGILVEPGNPQALLAGLKAATALGPAAGQHARTKAERERSRPAHMEQLLTILSDLAR
jgi:glycosyltransferase involved in cell wall biosynthesis